MTQTRQQSYVTHTIHLLALLVLATAALSTFKLSEAACSSRRVNLRSEIWRIELGNGTLEKTRKLTDSIKESMNAITGNQSCASSVVRYYSSPEPDDFPGVIADMFIDEEKVEDFENKLLDGIEYHYNDTVNHTMTPASRVFVVSFNVSNTSITDTNVTDAVKYVLGIKNETVTVLLKNESWYTLRIWMDMSVDKYPSKALEKLTEAVKNGSVHGIPVKSSSFMAFSAFPKSMTKIFEVKFDYATGSCSSNKSSTEYQVLKQNISTFLDMALNSSGYMRPSGINLECSSPVSLFVRASLVNVKVVALVEYSESKDPKSIGSDLQDCSSSNSKVSNVQVKLLNPSSLDESQDTVSIVCPTPSATTMPLNTDMSKKSTGTQATTPATQPPVMGKTPRLFVRLRLALTWSQFCSKLEESLKENIAKNVHDKKGNRVSSDRVVFINARKNCADPSKDDEQVDLWFYIANQTGSKTPSKCVTLKAYRVLKMMVDNGNTNMMGSDFKGKVIGLNLAGCDAKEFDNKDKMDDWILILIIIALVIGAILLFLACCCICCGAARRRRRRRHRDKYGNVEMVAVDADGNPQANGEGGKGRKKAKKHHKGGYYGGRGYGYSDSDDSDDYLCFGGRGGGGRGRGGDYDSDDDRRGRRNHSGGGGSGDGNLNGVDGGGKKGRGHRKGRRSGDGYDSDDSDVDQLCGGRRRGQRRTKDRKNKNKSGDEDGDGKGDKKGNNNLDVPKDDKGKENSGYEDVRSDSDKQAGGQPTSYQNLQYGLGDRKPSADGGYTSLTIDGKGDNTYATVDDAAKRQSRGGSVGSYGYVEINGGRPNAGGTGAGGAGAGGAGTGGAGAGAATAAGGAVQAGTAGLMAGSMADGNKRESLTPAIVTSPAPDSGSPAPRRGSGSRGGSPTASRPSSGSSLRNIDDELQRERRRSSIHSLVDDDAEPLKHKTATVGIVGLALRNKNEKKKETEFKNLDKEMPALGTYPANTAGKNRNPDILPNPRSRVKISSSPDYINASYLHDHKGQRRYIATQHPLLETKNDFWQMVWDNDCHLIVMVNDDENSKQMDYYPQYWPSAEGSSVDFNGIVVSTKQVVTKPDYVITSLMVSNTKTKPSTTREISHYRYTSWKEKDVPNIAMFVGFVVAAREIGRKYEDGNSPIVVHCSDGQGFTGVFVALDIGVRSHEENKTSVVDLFELAKRLRQGRSGIIDSIQLYNFTYQCLYEYTVNYDEEAEKKKD